MLELSSSPRPPNSPMQVMDRMCQMLHTKTEDLRIHNFVDEEHPELLEDEEKTIDELGFSENHKLLIESEASSSMMIIVSTERDPSWPMHVLPYSRKY